MFNLLAQYMGYGNDVEVTEVTVAEESLHCSFGDAEGEWTLVEVKNPITKEAVEEEFHRVRSLSPLESLNSSVIEDVDVPVVSAVTQAPDRRFRCAKTNKRQRTHNSNFTQHRPNQMKRNNQVFCSRGNKVFQKMRQIVHQPRKC